MKDTNNAYDFSLVEVLRFALRWKWHIIILTVLAGIASAIFSGPQFITPKYASKVVFYPSTINSISGVVLSDNQFKDKDALEFGQEEEAEYALQILNSAPLMTKVVEHFNLMEHYGIDPNGAYPYTELDNEIRSNISFKRTELLSIEIQVLDKDPQLAAEIANYISASLDTVKTQIQRQVAQKAFEIIEKEYQSKLKEVETLRDAINNMNASDDMVTNPFSRKNKKAARQDALLNADKLQGGSNLGTLLSLTESLSLQVEQLNELQRKYERAKVDLEEYIPHHFVVTPAAAAEKKVYPVRWMIVAISMMSTFFLSLVLILLIERIRNSYQLLKQEEN
ncbi:MAG: hypothetical protein LPK45_00550 [Bacteroidota bacterium]|nr:hypothetical protein [Bacteroidota bacterium]MDX5429516.1 hypothetical protein [Bacteroidota bacterium]MDX5468301.1 hypothetical protein [Bacteroidota bacterium]